MKNVKSISVSVEYRVGLGEFEMPEEVYNQIIEAMDNGDKINTMGLHYTEAAEWISSNIQERDCMDWECDVEDIELEALAKNKKIESD